MANTIPVAVVGVGHLGRRHAAIYAEMPSAELVCVCDHNEQVGRQVAAECRTRFVADYREVPGEVRAVSIATPTALHAEAGRYFLGRGTDCLIEKPLAEGITAANELVAAAETSNALLQVGHVERFNPALLAVQKYLDSPVYMEGTRISPFPFRSAQVGVIMDLMIHDIEILLHLAGSPVTEIRAMGAAVLCRSAEDVANVRLEFASGCVANVTASRVASNSARWLRIFTRESYISVDLLKRHALVRQKSPALENHLYDVENLSPEDVGPDPLTFVNEKLIRTLEPPVTERPPLQAELDAFLECVRTRKPPLVTGRHGLVAIQAAQRIREVMVTNVQRNDSGNVLFKPALG